MESISERICLLNQQESFMRKKAHIFHRKPLKNSGAMFDDQMSVISEITQSQDIIYDDAPILNVMKKNVNSFVVASEKPRTNESQDLLKEVGMINISLN
jgi:hypothetical protein